MADNKPVCGPTGLDGGMDTLGSLLWLFGILGTAIGIAQAIAAADILLAAIAGALIVFGIVCLFHYVRCVKEMSGPVVCTSGIINRIVPSFNSALDDVFAFTATHTRVDVVVNPRFWPEVEEGAEYIFCAEDTDRSPILSAFYKNKAVCAATLGAVVGAGIAAIIGMTAAYLLVGSISCGIWAWLCVILALLVVAILALVGAIIGGNAGRTISEGRALPTVTDQYDPILVGDYVAHIGTLVVHPDFDSAKVYWFAFADATKQMGRSNNSPPFSYKEARLIEGCPFPHIVL